jgi:hypothetical protein
VGYIENGRTYIMPYYKIKAKGRFYDEVYYEKKQSIHKVKLEFQKLLKTSDIIVTRILGRS